MAFLLDFWHHYDLLDCWSGLGFFLKNLVDDGSQREVNVVWDLWVFLSADFVLKLLEILSCKRDLDCAKLVKDYP